MGTWKRPGPYLAGITGSLLLGIAATSGASAQAAPEHPFDTSNAPTDGFPGGDLLRPENSTLTRHEDRVEIEIILDTPVPGTYEYPEAIPPERRAAPELFTAWVFIFNRPDHCVAATEPPRCGPDDFSEAVGGGVYNLAAHVTSIDHSGGSFELDRSTDGQTILRGEIVVGQAPRPDSPPGDQHVRTALDDPLGAEIHVAIAPHGQVDPATFATEAYEPAGNPGCGCWWVSTFTPPAET